MDVSISVQYRWKGEGEEDSRGDGLLGAVILLTFADEEVEINLLCLAEGLTGSEPSDIWLGLGPPLRQTYSGQDSLSWMEDKISTDLMTGQQGSHGTSFFPERLIKVDGRTPRLVLRDDAQEFPTGALTTSYAALSYCWGPAEDAKQQLKTTKDTLARRKTGIRDAEMTEVLRDAIAVTRALHIPYLWVDALCILQDDISDWERQCVSVASLYAGASVTICAASSTTCRRGFLQPRGTRIRVPFQSIRNPQIQGSFYLHFTYAGFSRDSMYNEKDADINLCRWGNRAWVYQERESASRMLLFGNANIHYIAPQWSISIGSSRVPTIEGLGSHVLDNQSREEVYRRWAGVLCRYAHHEEHSFTKVKDILPALSGLTSKYYEYLKDEFHAGLWKGDLFRGLMWYWEGGSETLPSRDCCVPDTFMRHYDCPLPSWSPLGRGMYITYGAIYKKDMCFTDFKSEYLNLTATTRPSGGNPFGEIDRNWGLQVNTHILDLSVLSKRSLEVEDVFDQPGCRGTLLYEGKHLGCFEMDFSYGDFSDMYGQGSDGSPVRMMDEIERFSWLLLGSCKVRHNDESPAQMRRARGGCGLILYSAPGATRFFRVGAFFPSFPEHHHEGLNLIKRLGRVQNVRIV
ncbi:unnamed protein product [Clonostachys rosea]|uniref:Heterokaryon incompatibility domain-containing protein n=1 Tax=Bionectria ochroleuca TaxID=29856 RepID=A0ABY6UDC6_BIOOC|nr:unnamed protein product [Clonostachys rosea]